MTEIDTLQQFLDQQLPAHCLGAVRAILPDDEELLTPLEAAGLENAIVSVRRASGAGRTLARALCKEIGVPAAELPRSPQRYPLWPNGLVGSIAHDAQFAAAVVALNSHFAGLGIDIEPSQHLSADILEMVASTMERRAFSDLSYGDKALFAIKEAVFKAVYPSDNVFLDFHDVNLDRSQQTATTSYGRQVNWRVLTFPRVLAIAWWK